VCEREREREREATVAAPLWRAGTNERAGRDGQGVEAGSLKHSQEGQQAESRKMTAAQLDPKWAKINRDSKF